MKVIVLGFDGMTLTTVKPMVDKNLLPHFKKIIEEGTYGILKTTIPPVTGPGWTSLTTGKEPGKHGIFEFRQREGYSSTLITKNTSAHAEPVWKILNRFGKRVNVVNVPMTYPPDEVSGVMISGLMTPSVNANFAWPPCVKDEIFELIPGYRIDIDEKTFLLSKNKKAFLAEIFKMTEDRRKVVNHIMEKYPSDFSFLTFVGSDRIQHFFWDEIVSLEPDCVTFFQLLDNILGDMLKRLDGDDVLFVVSDHGFTDGRKAFCINRFFQELGLSSLKSGGNLKKRLAKIGLTGDRIKVGLNRLGLFDLKERLHGNLINGLKKFIPNKQILENEIDWTKTKVFSLFSFGLIHINLKGREPSGIVNEDEYDSLCEFVKSELLKFRDPGNGNPVVKAVYRGTEIYNSEYGFQLPDLVIVTHEGYSIVTEFWKDIIADTRFGSLHMTGNHDLDGIFMAYGNPIKHLVCNARVYDIMPTLLYFMGCPIPEDVDGQVLIHIFKDDLVEKMSPVFEKAQQTSIKEASNLNQSDNDALAQRLKNLGYLG